MIYLLFWTQVKAAAEKALAEFKKKNPNADPSDIKVDIPKAPPAPAGPAGPGGIHYHAVYNQNVNNNNYFNIAAMNAHQARLQQMPQPQAGIWGAGMYMPPAVVHPGAPIAAAPPVPAVLPPAPVPGRRAPARGPALIAQARRAGTNRRRANPDGPRIAHHAAHLRGEPAPIQHRRATQPGPEIPAPALAPQNFFHFGLAAPGGLGIMPQQQQQHLQEAFNVNERLARQRLADGRGAHLNDRRRGIAAPANPALADDERNQLERRLLDAQQRVMRERMVLMQEQQQQMEPLGVYQAQGLPAMGYRAALGMPMVPQNFGGPQYQARK